MPRDYSYDQGFSEERARLASMEVCGIREAGSGSLAWASVRAGDAWKSC